jgi:transposase-like protein
MKKSKTEALTLMHIMLRFPDVESARVYLESKLWPDGPVCPKCSATDPYKLTARPTSKTPGRKGLYKCSNRDCRKQFTVTVGTISRTRTSP